MNQHARIEHPAIAFIDVAAQRRRLGRRIDEAIARVLAHCRFVMGVLLSQNPRVRVTFRRGDSSLSIQRSLSCAPIQNVPGGMRTKSISFGP